MRFLWEEPKIQVEPGVGTCATCIGALDETLGACSVVANCVSPFDDRPVFFASPWEFPGELVAAVRGLKAEYTSLGATITEEDDSDHLSDATVCIRAAPRAIDCDDYGRNRKRLEQIRMGLRWDELGCRTKQQIDRDATINCGHSFGVRPGRGTTTRRKRFRANAVDPEGERNWWQRILFQPIPVDEEDDQPDREGYGIDDPMVDTLEGEESSRSESMDSIDEMLADDARFSEWQRRSAVREEVREFGKTRRDSDSKDWKDWLDDTDNSGTFGVKDGGWYYPEDDWEKDGMPRAPPKKPVRGMKRTVIELFFRMFEPEEDVEADLKFEGKIFRYTSRETAKFATILLIIPFLVDFSVHDYVLVPFLKRYVETVPLAAEVFDVRKTQKLKMIRELKLERQRVRFEAEIGKAPPLSEEELADHLRHEALELQDEYRAENRAAFASIWSDAVAVFTFFMLLILNPNKVAIMSMTGDRLFTNISDTGKAFIIILLTDIFLGYHSSMGWETVIEMVLERYGFDPDQGAIYLFVAVVPVTIDAFFKLWVFRYFTRLSPSAAATFREMSRH